MQPKPPRLILWDWNGTLLDDVQLCRDALNRLLARYGYPQRYDMDAYREVFGFPVEDYYRRAGFDFARHSFAELAASFMQDYAPAAAACGLMPGALDALEAFRGAGVRQVILSASRLSDLERQVAEQGIGRYFETLLGIGDIYARSKVEIGRDYLARCGLPPQDCVMVGDSVHDFEVARALGVRCVLQASGHQPRHKLEATGAPVADGLDGVVQRLL